MGRSLHLFGDSADQAIVEVAIFIGDDPFGAYPRNLVSPSHICHF